MLRNFKLRNILFHDAQLLIVFFGWLNVTFVARVPIDGEGKHIMNTGHSFSLPSSEKSPKIPSAVKFCQRKTVLNLCMLGRSTLSKN